jgi:RecB family exonuclease
MPTPLLRLARYRDIAREIAERLVATVGDDPLRAWSEEVIVSSNSVGQAIASELLARLPSGVAGLRLQTLEALAKRILNDAGEYPRVADVAERRLAMRTAVRSVEEPADMSIMDSRGMPSMLERSHRDLRDSGVTLSDLQPRGDRTRTVARAWREYERLIAQLGAIDPADLLERAAAKIAAGAAIAPQLIAGFYDMTGVQLRLVEALRDAGKLAAIWIPAGEGETYRFAQSFVKRFVDSSVEIKPMLRVEAPRVSIVEGDTKHSELRAVCTGIAKLLAGGVGSNRIGIVARSLDGHDAELIDRFAKELGFTTTWTNEVPLVAHRIGRGLVTFLRLRERDFPRADVIELVRNGLKTKVRINVDETDVETRKARIAGGASAALGTLRRRSRAVDDYVALVSELESLIEDPRSGRDWSDLLTRLNTLFRIETSTDLAAAEEVDRVADLFRRAHQMTDPRGGRNSQPVRFDVATVIDALQQCSIAQRAIDDGHPNVWLGDVMQLRGRTFEHLFVIRMQDDLFPQRRIEDPLLPDSERRIAHVRQIGNGRDEEQFLFQLLFDAAESSIHFSYSGSDGFGKVLRKSQFLRGLSGAVERIEARGGHGNRQPATGDRQRPLALLARAGTSGIFDGYVGPRESFRRALQSVTPTQLEDFGECPQKFLFKWILNVRDVEDPEREVQINHRDKGSIDHTILERFYQTLTPEAIAASERDLPRLPTEIEERLGTIVDQEFDRLEAEQPAFNRAVRAIERRQTKRNLHDFVSLDFADLIARHLMPRHFEYRFGPKYRERADHPEPFMLDAGGVPIRVEGSIDRIDSGAGGFRIVDYKSGKALRHQELARKIDRGVRLQLALYAMAASEFFHVDASSISGTIKPLVSGKPAKFEFNLGEKRASLFETLDIFVHAIAGGIFPAFPNDGDRPEDFNSCKYCPVNHSCRTRHDAEEKYAVTSARDPRTLLSMGSGLRLLGSEGSSQLQPRSFSADPSPSFTAPTQHTRPRGSGGSG